MSEQSDDVDEQGEQSFPASDPPSSSPPIEDGDPRRTETLDEPADDDEEDERLDEDEELESESQTQGDIP
jgi:hypothetical protein